MNVLKFVFPFLLLISVLELSKGQDFPQKETIITEGELQETRTEDNLSPASSRKLKGQEKCATPDSMQSTGLSSKQFYFPGKHVNYAAASKLCAAHGLQLATMQTEFNVDHLAKFVESKFRGGFEHLKPYAGYAHDRKEQYTPALKSAPRIFWLGYTLKNQAYISQDNKVIRFQNIRPDIFKEKKDELNCLTIGYLSERAHMVPTSCDLMAAVLCQYPPGDPCAAGNVQDASLVDDGLTQAGKVGRATFFVSDTQMGKVAAKAYCEKNGANLLDVQSQVAHEGISKIIKEWAASAGEGFLEDPPPLWTSGKIEKGKLIWSTSHGDKQMNERDSILNNLIMGSSGQDQPCLALWPTEKEGGQAHSELLSVPCYLPNYFLCYKGQTPKDFQSPEDSMTNYKETLKPSPVSKPSDRPTKPKPNVSGGSSGTSGVIEEEDLPRSCWKIAALPEISIGIDVNMTKEEYRALIEFSRDSHIDEANLDIPFKSEAEWRKPLVTIIGNIFSKACPADLIPLGFTNTITVLFSVYLNSLGVDLTESKVGTAVWEEILLTLQTCENIAGSIDKVGLNENTHKRVAWRRNEIIDIFFTMFDLTLAACMPLAKDPSIWAADYYHSFKLDYMLPLAHTWLTQSEYDMRVIVGDIELDLVRGFVEGCKISAYMMNGLPDRSLLRIVSQEMKKRHQRLHPA